MERARVLFNTIKEACINDLGVQFEYDIKDNTFLIEELDEDLYYIHAANFTTRLKCIVEINNEYAEKGTWKKVYIFEEISKLYGKSNIGLDKIAKFIKNNITNLL